MLRESLTRRQKESLKFLVPVFVVLIVMQVFPFIYNIYLSLTSWFPPAQDHPSFIGFGNYIRAFHDSVFLNSLKVQVLFTILTITFELLLGLGVALLLNREIRMRNTFRTLVLLPMMATPAAMTLVWKVMYNPTTGIINKFLQPIYTILGVEPLTWVGSSATALWSVIIISVWRWAPFATLILLAGLQSIPKLYYEVAEISGASGWQKFRFVTLPSLKISIITILLFRSIDSLKTFAIIHNLTGGGPSDSTQIPNLYIFFKAFEGFKLGYSSALSMILFFVAMALAVVSIYLLRRGG